VRAGQALLAASLAFGCLGGPSFGPTALDDPGALPPPAPRRAPAPLDERALLPASRPAATTPPYRIGPGDGLRVTVIGEAELSGAYTVGPDGSIAIPLAGKVSFKGLDRDEAAELLRQALAPFFATPPSVAIDVTNYQNNKAYVLGRVEKPGVVELTGQGTLLQALAQAGGLPVREYRSYLARCAIIRGSEEILWVDLVDLLQGGNIALDVPLQNGDIVYIPDSEDTIVFVMGEVNSPGAVPIKVELSLTQALALAGGAAEDADLSQVYLVRADENGGPGSPVHIDVNRLLETADFSLDYDLKSGDILYVARTGFGDVSYVLRKLAPAFGLAASAQISE
jgi:polysaccharide export outer membrane protein